MSDILRNLSTGITTFEIIIGVVVSVILAHLWIRAVENLFYNALGFPKNSFYASVVIAIGMTIFLFVLLSGFNEISRSVVLGTDDPVAKTSQLLNVSTSTGVVNIAPRCVENGKCGCNDKRRCGDRSKSRK